MNFQTIWTPKKSIMELMKQSKSKSKLIKSIIISWRKAIKLQNEGARAYVAEFHSAYTANRHTHAHRLHCSKLKAIDTIARPLTCSLALVTEYITNSYFFDCIWVGYFSQVWLYAIV